MNKFHLGRTLATPGALTVLEQSGQSPAIFLNRHVRGDWGEVDAEDQRANDEALVSGERLLSAYRTLKGQRIWIITEADRSHDDFEALRILILEREAVNAKP